MLTGSAEASTVPISKLPWEARTGLLGKNEASESQEAGFLPRMARKPAAMMKMTANAALRASLSR